MRAAVAARLARRPPAQEAAAPPAAVDRDDDVDNEEVTDATFDERMRAKVVASGFRWELQEQGQNERAVGRCSFGLDEYS